MKWNQVSLTIFVLHSVFFFHGIHGIRKLPDLKAKEDLTAKEISVKKIGEDYYDGQRKKIYERYVHFNAKYKTHRSKPEHTATYTYDEVPAGNVVKYKYQPMIGNKIVAVKDIKLRRKTSKLFDTNDPLIDVSHNTFNENDNLLSNTLENEPKTEPIIDIHKQRIDKRKDYALIRKPHRYFSKLYKIPSDDIDDPTKDISYVLKDFSSEIDRNPESENLKIKPITDDALKPRNFYSSKTHNSISRRANNRYQYFTNVGFGNSNNLYKIHPETNAPAKEISFVLQDNYTPEDDNRLFSGNDPKIDQILYDTPRTKEELLLDDGYYVDSAIKFNKPEKHFTDLYNIETKKKNRVVPLQNNTDADTMTLKIWKALQNIKSWMNDS